MPPTSGPGPATYHEPVSFSYEDALLSTWVDDGGPYLELDTEPDSGNDEE